MKRNILALAMLIMIFCAGCSKTSQSNPIQPEPTAAEQKAIDEHTKTVNDQERQRKH